MILRLRERGLDLSEPVLMGIVNATPDSFSDRHGPKRLDDLVALALAQVEAGAAIVDVGGESGRTDTDAVAPEEEIARVEPLVRRLAERGVAVSVDTWRAQVARAALDAGAVLVNDVSALSDTGVARECARTGAGLVVTHTRARPKQKAFPEYEDVVEDVAGLLDERARLAADLGVRADGIVLDPGLDLAKSPAESVRVLRELERLAELGRPLLVAASRKDFVGALTGRPPAARDAGTLAALGAAVRRGARILRVHDVAGAHDYLRVHGALEGGSDLAADARLDAALMREGA